MEPIEGITMRCILRQQIYNFCCKAMEYRSIKGYSGWTQLAFLMVFLGSGFVLTAVIQMVIGMMMVPEGTSFQQVPKQLVEAMAKPENVNYTRAIQLVGTFSLMFIPAILFSLLVNGPKIWWMGFNQYLNARQVFFGFLLIFFANIMALPITDFTKSVISHYPALNHYAAGLEDEYNKQVAVLSNLKGWGEYIVAIFIIAFFPALFEEIFFRGALQNLLVKWWKNAFLGILVTAILFSLIHLSVYLFVSRLILGFILGLMFYKTKNLWVNIIAHFLNNLIAVTQMFYLGKEGKTVDVHKMDPDVTWWGGVLAFILILFFTLLLDKYSRTNVERIAQRESELLDQAKSQHPFLNI